jgi:hypothetical protein
MNFIRNRLTNKEFEMAFTDLMTNIIVKMLLSVFMIQINTKLSNNYQD